MKWEQEDIIEYLIDSYCSHYRRYHHFQKNDNEVDTNYEMAICDYIFETLQTITGGSPIDVADKIDEVLEGVFLFDPRDDEKNFPIKKGDVVYAAQDIYYSDIRSFCATFDEDDQDDLVRDAVDVDYDTNRVYVPKGTKMTYIGCDPTCSGWPTFDIHGFELDFAGDPFKLKRYPGE